MLLLELGGEKDAPRDRVKPLRTLTAAHTPGLVNLVLSRQTVFFFFFAEYEHPFIV